MHRLLCSTGALLGRANGRDFRLLPGFSKQLRCDGLELMFYDSWYQQEEAIVSTLKTLALPILTFHAEKNICQGILNPETTALALEHFQDNCRLAHAAGAEKIVFHLWDGYMNHDQICSMFSFLPELNGMAKNEKLLFTVEIMVMAQIVLITPIVVGNMETYVSGVAPAVRETAKGLGLSGIKTFFLLCSECVYPIISAYLLAFARAIAEVGAVSMVGGAISWKTNVMTTAIMQYTNQGNFSLGIALGMILMTLSLLVNILISMLQRRLSR